MTQILPSNEDIRESAIFFLIGRGARVKDICNIFKIPSGQLSFWLEPMEINLAHIAELSKREVGRCLNCYVLSETTFCCEECGKQFIQNENILTTAKETGIIPTLFSKHIYFDVEKNRVITNEIKRERTI